MYTDTLQRVYLLYTHTHTGVGHFRIRSHFLIAYEVQEPRKHGSVGPYAVCTTYPEATIQKYRNLLCQSIYYIQALVPYIVHMICSL